MNSAGRSRTRGRDNTPRVRTPTPFPGRGRGSTYGGIQPRRSSTHRDRSSSAQRNPFASAARNGLTPARREHLTGAIASSALSQSSQRTAGSSAPSRHTQSDRRAGPTVMAGEVGYVSETADEVSCSAEVILALDMRRNGTLGSAYYVAFEQRLYVQQDIPTTGTELVGLLLVQVQPTTVIVPNRISDELLAYLKDGTQSVEGSSADSRINGAYTVHTIGSSEFNPVVAKEKLGSLALDTGSRAKMTIIAAGEKNDGSSTFLKFGPLGDQFQGQVSIGCAGAVLGHLNRRATAEYLPGESDELHELQVRYITTFCLGKSMFVNHDTHHSLDITRSELHPSGRSSGAKEGLSVYGVFRKQASTPQGKLKLHQMLLRPSTDLDLLEGRHRAVAALVRPENSRNMRSIRKKLRTIKDMHSTIQNLHKGLDRTALTKSGAKGVWRHLATFSKSTVELFGAIRALAGVNKLPIIEQMMREVRVADMMTVGKMVVDHIDFEGSATGGRTVVLRGADDRLDECRRQYEGVGDLLSHVKAGLIAEVPGWARGLIEDCKYDVGRGFLTVVMAEDMGSQEPCYEGEELNDDFWEMDHSLDGKCYFKNNAMRELDRQYPDLFFHIGDVEVEILHNLRCAILEHEEAILLASNFWGEFDCLAAMAAVAEIERLTEPRMTTSNVIKIEGGRHFLYERVVDTSFVANDCFLAGGPGDAEHRESDGHRESSPFASSSVRADTPSMMLLTGPNNSGKSVYLKQVALIVYLAHVGSFVPAARATIGVVDRILTRVSTRESVSRQESAFVIDLRQVKHAVDTATRRSLVLIDEFGKGTNPVDGAALAAAVFRHFAALPDDKRPKVLAATHFHEIYQHGFLNGLPSLRYMHMEVTVDYKARERTNQVAYLYNLKPGWCTSSFGTICAALNGIDDKVLQRAEEINLLLARGENLQAACAKLSLADQKELADAEVIARAFVAAKIPDPDNPKPGEETCREMLRRILSLKAEDSEESSATPAPAQSESQISGTWSSPSVPNSLS